MKFIFLLLSLIIQSQTWASSNKEIVIKFYDLAFNKHKPDEAMKLYTGDKYIQHNPFAGDGKKPFIDFFTSYYSHHPSAFVEVKRVIAQDDLVMVHVHSRKDKRDRGSAVVDIFRLENGKIVEHWDVVQAIPEEAANNNTMF